MKSPKKRNSKSKGRSTSVDFSASANTRKPAPSTISSTDNTPQRLLARRSKTAPSTLPTPASLNGGQPDYVLVCCYILVYLELGWLVLLLWRSWGSPTSWFLPT